MRGLDFNGRNLTEQTRWTGSSERPSHLAEIGSVLDATAALRFTDSFRFHKYNIAGETSETITTLVGTPTSTVPQEEFKSDIEVRNIENRVDAEYLFSRRFAVRAGYRYGYRKVLFLDPEAGSSEVDTTFTTNTFLGSLSYRPNNRLNVFLEYQNGSQDNAFTRIEPMDFQIVRLRPSWRISDKLAVNGSLIYRRAETPNDDLTTSEVNFATGSFAIDYNPQPETFIRLGSTGSISNPTPTSGSSLPAWRERVCRSTTFSITIFLWMPASRCWIASAPK